MPRLPWKLIGQIEKLNEQRASVADISARLGVPEGTVRAVLQQRSYRRPVLARGTEVAGAVLDDRKVAELRRLSAEGQSKTALAKRFKITVPHVIAVIRGTTWQHVNGAVTDATLTVAQVREIRTKFREGATLAELSVAFGRTATTIGKVVRGRSFADAGGPIATKPNLFRPKLTGPKAAQLVREYIDGESVSRLADKYRINDSTVRGLVRPFEEIRAVWKARQK